MDATTAGTRFLPAERSSPEELRRQLEIIASNPLLRETLDAMPQLGLILNERRQILFANRAVTQALGRSLDTLVGLRTGEVLGCIRAKLESGCGTTEYCAVCGVGRAMLGMMKGASLVEQECRMLVDPPGLDRDLLVRTSAMKIGGSTFSLLIAADRSGETRRRMLEKLFFHDTLNTAGAVHGLAEILPDAGKDLPMYCELLRTSSEQLLDQILSQRDLLRVENGDYALKPERLDLTAFLKDIAGVIGAHPVAAGRAIKVEPGAPAGAIVTDRGLLMRVVGNMLKNAVEAELPGAVVNLGCYAGAGGGVEIWVRNPAVMPREVQLQLFQRAFSTKGPDRGLGTYSIRLLCERYLGGAVTFRSDVAHGTEFRIALPATPGRVRP